MLSTNRNMYTIYAATIKNFKIGHKSDVTTVAMVTLAIFKYLIVAACMVYIFLFLESTSPFKELI